MKAFDRIALLIQLVLLATTLVMLFRAKQFQEDLLLRVLKLELQRDAIIEALVLSSRPPRCSVTEEEPEPEPEPELDSKPTPNAWSL